MKKNKKGIKKNKRKIKSNESEIMRKSVCPLPSCLTRAYRGVHLCHDRLGYEKGDYEGRKSTLESILVKGHLRFLYNK